ncbi:hypothetical protein AKJ09_08702 [Labilithrix luteola]|uniref:Uncharacterized protein n=1 Tax=Labilithrix luteola TaxID=1391654 RepID=A0A0K1Q8I3_9BACT|nr:hypothetical protein [Labilithrix luteola]AKV02039.1 hypothetical protein AKJ09_08702 [Labilithrix luteola]
MIRNYVGLALVLSSTCVWAVGCSDDEANTDSTTVPDGGRDGSLPTTEPTPEKDGGADGATTGTTCPATTGIPQRLIITGGAADTEVVAFNLETKQVDGRYAFSGFGGASAVDGPYALEQASDIVTKFDRNEPWKPVASWNVRSNDGIDGGATFADPAAVVAPACGKGYILRYNRNRIAVIDTTKSGDAGAADSFIDLSSLVQSADSDGSVDPAAAVHVAAKNRLYVVLGNTDLKKVKVVGGYTNLLCSESKTTLIAIDTTTDKLVSLGGTGPGGGIELPGYNTPINANALAYDAAADRLLVLQGGCVADAPGDAVGDMQQREVDAVDLATGKASKLLDLNDKGFPVAFAFADSTHAALNFYGPTYFWDPSKTTLGAELPGALEYITHDGKGNLLGIHKAYNADFTPIAMELYSTPFTNAATVDESALVKIGAEPFTDNAGSYPSSLDVWPRP